MAGEAGLRANKGWAFSPRRTRAGPGNRVDSSMGTADQPYRVDSSMGLARLPPATGLLAGCSTCNRMTSPLLHLQQDD